MLIEVGVGARMDKDPGNVRKPVEVRWTERTGGVSAARVALIIPNRSGVHSSRRSKGVLL